MGALDILQWLRCDGFELSLLQSGGLAVQPASKLTEAQRQALRNHKTEIVEALQFQENTQDPDRHCWPHTTAMNSEEIDTFTARVQLFNIRGLTDSKAEQMADVLVVRDREADKQRLCLECPNLLLGGGLFGCKEWKRAGLGGASVPNNMVTLLQRCDGFKETT